MPHTPAPWKLVIDPSYTSTKNGNVVPEYAWIWDKDQKDIVAYNVFLHPNDRANTILMTAAPELLSACETALIWIKINFPSWNSEGQFMPIVSLLESVIKKATEGEQ